MTSLQDLPSVDQLLKTEFAQEWIAAYGRPLTVEAIRVALGQARASYPESGRIPTEATLLAATASFLESWTTPTLQPVINAAGVILHTNLGRAPLSQAALEAA